MDQSNPAMRYGTLSSCDKYAVRRNMLAEIAAIMPIEKEDIRIAICFPLR
jgi:hypothetical protein